MARLLSPICSLLLFTLANCIVHTCAQAHTEKADAVLVRQIQSQPSLSAADPADMETVRSLVLEAYGGRKLSDLTSISIKSDRRLAFPGSNYSPDLNEFVEDRYHFQIDLIGQRGSSERYIHQNGNIYHDRTTTTPNGLAEITYPLSRVTYKNGVDFYARFGAVFRLSDTLLAYTIATQPNRTKLATPSFFRASQYHNVELTLPGSDEPIIVSVDTRTGYIMQLRRSQNARNFIYIFRNHRTEKGIVFAQESQIFIDGALFDYEVRREIEPNAVQASAFEVESTLKPYIPDANDTLVGSEVLPKIHHYGRRISHTTFVENDGFVIAAGGDDNLQERYEAFRKANPNAGPLRYLIISHDHEFNRSGYKDAIALGATLLVSKTLEPNIDRLIGKDGRRRIQYVQSGDTLGPVEFFEIGTVHTHSLILTYVAGAKVILEDDHYRPLFKGEPEYLFPTTTDLVRKVNALGIDVDHLISSHGSKLESWKSLTQVTHSKAATSCWFGRKICEDKW